MRVGRIRIKAEEGKPIAGRKRYHFVAVAPFLGKICGTPGRAKSMGTWATKRGAIVAGIRNYPDAEKWDINYPC